MFPGMGEAASTAAGGRRGDRGRVLVTGGAGFIGLHLCEALLDRGHTVVCLDDFSTGQRAFAARLGAERGLVVREANVVDPFIEDVERVYHLACPASPAHYQRDPVATIRTCVEGTRNALACARASGARILLASTSEVYGEPAIHPQVESYWGNVNPVGVRACYAEAKRCAEALAIAFAQLHRTEIRIARIFNAYGPHMPDDDGRVIPTFIVQALHGAPLTVHGTGAQTRSFCYADDLVRGMIALMELDEARATGDGLPRPVNLGMPVEHSIASVAELVIALCSSRSRLEHLPKPADDPSRRRPDTTLARRLLAWEPAITLADGLERTIAAFRARRRDAR